MKGQQASKDGTRTLRGRFAPSPTGALHLGHAQTLLLGWLQIRALGGLFVLRIEDIDTARNRPGAIENIYRDMEWLGFDWDEGPKCGGPCSSYLQSERTELYEQAIQRLKERTYPCSCSRKDVREAAGAPHIVEIAYPGTCSQGTGRTVVPTSTRVQVPPGQVAWHDLCLGPKSEDPSEICGDFIVRAKDGAHVYQLACVADDIDMGITHVLRGEDLVSSTSRQLLLYRWLASKTPLFAHTPLRRDEEGQRLAKRRGSPSLHELRHTGEKPRDLLGRLARDLGLLPEATPCSPSELLGPFTSAWASLLGGSTFDPDRVPD
jgi:glutamyl-tRNA synthetase